MSTNTPAAKRKYKDTGWIMYHICDRSGGGWKEDRWVYSPGSFEEGDDSIREFIVERYESWAIHAERYSFEFFLGRLPPAKIIADWRDSRRRRAQRYLEEAGALQVQLYKVLAKRKITP